MGSGTMFRKLGVAVVATAFTALVGITAASAASTTSSMTTTQGAAAGTGGGAATAGTKPNRCEARADKRHLAGDQRDSYVKRCMAQTNTKHKKPAAKSTTMQQPQSGSTTSSQ
jgi:hypothetical protein